jgi:hypothetical protein
MVNICKQRERSTYAYRLNQEAKERLVKAILEGKEIECLCPQPRGVGKWFRPRIEIKPAAIVQLLGWFDEGDSFTWHE